MDSSKSITIKDKTFIPYITHKEIISRIKVLADRINNDYKGKELHIIGVMTGCYMFMAYLTEELTIPVHVTTIKVSSYKGTESSDLSLDAGIKEDLTGKNVLFVEDIVDSGKTMEFLLRYVSDKNTSSVEIASLFVKPIPCNKSIKVEYVGFEIPPKFIVGFGLDYDGYGRNLKNIYQLNN